MSNIVRSNVRTASGVLPFKFRQLKQEGVFQLFYKDVEGDAHQFVVRPDPCDGGFYSHVKGSKKDALVEGGHKTPKAAFVATVFHLFG